MLIVFTKVNVELILRRDKKVFYLCNSVLMRYVNL